MNDQLLREEDRGHGVRELKKVRRLRAPRRTASSLWSLLRDLGRSRTGLVLVALFALAWLGGLSIIVVAGYLVSVQVANVTVYVGPSASALPATNPRRECVAAGDVAEPAGP